MLPKSLSHRSTYTVRILKHTWHESAQKNLIIIEYKFLSVSVNEKVVVLFVFPLHSSERIIRIVYVRNIIK